MNHLRVCSLLLSLVIVCSSVRGQSATNQQLTVEAIYREFDSQEQLPDELVWLPQTDRYSYVSTAQPGTCELYSVEAESGEKEVVITSAALDSMAHPEEGPSITTYQWLPHEDGLVFTGSDEVWLYSLNTRELRRLTHTPAEEEVVRISPDGRFVSYGRDNNLFVYDLSSKREIQLTTDGALNLLNGKLDWVYQEELIGRGIFQGYWWAPDSRHISYLQFDESPVPEYPLVDWIPYHPDLEMMRYPKAGDPNPVVRLGVVPVQQNPHTTWIDIGREKEYYIPRVYWLPGGEQLAFMRVDRLQQHLNFFLANIATGESELLLEESDPYWINIEDQVYFFRDADRFVWGSERDGYRHLYLYGNEGELIDQLTRGNWIVEDLEKVDEARKYIYFTATKQSVTERHLYRMKTDGSQLTRLTNAVGSNSADFSRSGSYFINSYSDLLQPEQLILEDHHGDRVRYIEQNPQPIEKYNLQEPEIFTFRDENGVTFYASLLKPPNFNPDKKYPVLIYVYGGPHVQVVRRSYGESRALWHHMMAQQGYLVFSMDNRGSFARGHRWEQVIYQHMGETELSDQLRGVRYLKSLPYVDPNRIGIWGWSYGGYMTLYALTHSEEFRAGVSVAPVTDWRNYDTIYTERYMGLPQENTEGYSQSSPVTAAENLSGYLLLVHGTGDDNVHFQNAVQMVDALIDAGKPFDLMIYPQQKHGIQSVEDRIHLYQKITDFFDTHLK
ncbi:MAG TPA: DPP IV N-terminal domain-containing protein [bacterium]|nr:DPP IV N-terminal domain-containing protein [bacterium]